MEDRSVMKIANTVAASLLGAALAITGCSGFIDGGDEKAAAPGAGGSGGGSTGGSAGGSWGGSAGASGVPNNGGAHSGGVPGVDDAEIASIEFPSAIACQKSAAAKITVKNAGSSTWTPDAGYALGAVGDSDPLSPSTRIALPAGTAVAPGQSWEFALTLNAPDQAGSYLSDWQMVREQVAWFGQSVAPTVAVECEQTWPPTPYRFDVVQQVASQYGHLLQTNTWESCGEFVQRVLVALNDPDWGHVGKTEGEGQYSPPGFSQWVDGYLLTGFSHDVIWHKPSNRQVDIVINAAANSDANPAIHGPASVGWEEIEREHYRDNNPWLPAIPP
jgi:hypothetical protein